MKFQLANYRLPQNSSSSSDWTQNVCSLVIRVQPRAKSDNSIFYTISRQMWDPSKHRLSAEMSAELVCAPLLNRYLKLDVVRAISNWDNGVARKSACATLQIFVLRSFSRSVYDAHPVSSILNVMKVEPRSRIVFHKQHYKSRVFNIMQNMIRFCN